MTTDLAGLMVKWLTHDLASPIATAMTASELLSDAPDAEINGLVVDATKRLAGRLRLIRAALAPGQSPMGAIALENLIRGGIDGTPLTWSRTTADADAPTAALIAGIALLLADLRRGQPLAITETGIHWPAPHALPDTVTAALSGHPATDTRAAVAQMLAATAAHAGLVLTATADGVAWN